jgi:HEAT repeat protein
MQASVIAVAVVFIVAAALLVAVVTLKWVHRRRVERSNSRRAQYVRLISQHLADPGSVTTLTQRQSEDDAFIDAVIDVRNTVVGSSVDRLEGLVDRAGLISLQSTRLRSRFPLGRRLRAVVSLAEIGDISAAEVLIDHLSDHEPEVRIQCARGLARMHHTPAIDEILERFNQETPWVRSRYADTLQSFGKTAAWPLAAFIRVNHAHADNVGVPEAARVLGKIGEREVGPELAELLYTVKDIEVAVAIIECLGDIGGHAALRPLRRTFMSDEWRLRAKTAAALGEIGDPSVNPMLYMGLSDPSWWMRRNCAASLARLPGGIDFLYDALDSTDTYARDSAAESLADVGELIESKIRVEEGTAEPRHLRLIEHMQRRAPVPS